MSKWPRDNQADLIRFYGDPGTGAPGKQLVKIVPPFQMYYDGKPLKTLSFHKKAAPALLAALTQVWEYYGRDQATIDKLGISKTAGTYNPRKVRGSKTKWSNHAYGAAIDINAEQNGFNVAGNIPLPMICAFKAQGARWGGDYKGRKDPMHLEFCDGGEPQRSFEEWLAHYKVKPAIAKPVPALAAPAAVVVVQGDPNLWHVQRRLKAMNYSPGELDGLWGGITGGAISGFINDRKLKISAPTSMAMFRTIHDALTADLAKAESEKFTRPIAVERAEATPAELAPKLPEVQAAMQAERLGFWGSIAGGVSAVVTGIANFMGDAIEWLSKLKEVAGDIPWYWWTILWLAVSFALYMISRKSGEAKNAATQAYQEGART